MKKVDWLGALEHKKQDDCDFPLLTFCPTESRLGSNEIATWHY